MLFNSYEFLFLFLPVTLAGFFWGAQISHRLAALWLGLASLFFYCCWNPAFVPLLLASIGFNYGMGYAIGHTRNLPSKKSTRILVAAIGGNLLLLGYFKYTNFFITSANHIVGTQWGVANIVLPLGISFFTFTQIAFLVDVYKGIAREYNFSHYLLFVTYFPHLIAGPVLHHKQMMPQFGNAATYKLNLDNFNNGLTVFTIGLFKKVVLADQFALYANPVFDATASGGEPMLIEAWLGALTYTLQLYFDFSGYSDMAIGLSRLFNINLPINFNSPYKAKNIIEFWRRWHMTLSAFLRDYLYIPLGGNRFGVARRYANLMTTMLLGGLWHGAGWTFVLWGGLHGIYLVLNHGWYKLYARLSLPGIPGAAMLAGFVTFLAIVIGWVVFRANNINTAAHMLLGMSGYNGISLPKTFGSILTSIDGLGVHFDGIATLSKQNSAELSVWLIFGLGIVWFMPNTQELSEIFNKRWRNSRFAGGLIGMIFVFAIMNFSKHSPFIYFQF